MHQPFARTAPAYWGSKAKEYDAFIRRVVPRYDELNARLLMSLPNTPRHVLELGCGTGALSLHLVEQAPAASFTFVDAAPEMIATTRARVTEHAPEVARRARYLEVRFEDLALQSSYDVIVSSLSLHHVVDPAPLYRSLSAALVPGGGLRVADGYAAESSELQALHLERWEAFWREPENLTTEEIAQVRQHVASHDHYLPLSTHFRALTAAGFRHCDCIWRDGLFAIITAQLPPGADVERAPAGDPTAG